MQVMEKPLVLCEVGDRSPFCLKVRRALIAAGLSYESRLSAMPSTFKAHNPTGQVPVLLVGDEPVCDSTAILARIASDLAPGAFRADAESWLWEDYADRALNGYLVAARWADDANWPRVRDAYFGKAPWFVRKLIVPRIRNRVLGALMARDFLRAGSKVLLDDFRRILDALEARAPRTGFWTGASLSVADLGLFGQLHALRTPLTPGQARDLELRPALVDYLDRVDAATSATKNAIVTPLRRAS